MNASTVSTTQVTANNSGRPELTQLIDLQKALQRSNRLMKDATYQRNKRLRLKLELLRMPAHILTPDEIILKTKKRKHKTDLERTREQAKHTAKKRFAEKQVEMVAAFASASIAKPRLTRKQRVDLVYLYIQQATGSLGCSGSGGPIAGELTIEACSVS